MKNTAEPVNSCSAVYSTWLLLWI